MKNRLNVGFDCDDILVPFVHPFLEYYNGMYGTDFRLEDVWTYDISKVFGITVGTLKDRIANFVSTDMFRNLPPFEGAVKGIEKLANDGHKLYVISNRRNDLRDFTQDYMKRHFPDKFTDIHLTNWAALTGQKTTKCQAVENYGIEVFVEDCFEMSEEIAEKGKKVIMLNYPWNSRQTIRPDLQDRIYRKHSWEGIVGKIDELSCSGN